MSFQRRRLEKNRREGLFYAAFAVLLSFVLVYVVIVYVY
jgi:cell division septal protein FtsQ